MMDLRDRLVLVTGASSGIGEATALAVARRRGRVVLLARRQAELERVAAAITAQGGNAAVFPVDLSDPDAVAAVAASVKRDIGIPDVIVNNAGAGRWIPLIETSAEEAEDMITLPYLAAVYSTKAFLGDMINRGSGQIVNVTSPASYLVWPRACGYIAARHALRGFADALRADLAGTGVGVTLVVLGTVNSPYWEKHPGSRANTPKPLPLVMKPLTPATAASVIVQGIERQRRQIVRPRAFQAFFALNALFPALTAKAMDRPSGNATDVGPSSDASVGHRIENH